MRRYVLSSLLLLLVCPALFAQKSELGIMGGVSTYNGELNRKTQFKLPGMAFGGFYRYNFNSHFSTKLCFLYGTVQGADSLSGNVEQVQRNLSFRSVVTEFSAQLEINFLPFEAGEPKTPFTPYIFGGIGVFTFNPQAYVDAGAYQINGNTYTVGTSDYYDLRPLGTEGQGTAFGQNTKKYALASVSVPFGMGVKVNIASGIGFGIEWGMRPTFTDYLDDVSTTYADPALLNSTSSAVAAVLSDRSIGITESNVGRQRGNSTNNDWYSFAVASLTYRIKNRKHGCAAYDHSKPKQFDE